MMCTCFIPSSVTDDILWSVVITVFGNELFNSRSGLNSLFLVSSDFMEYDT